MYSSLKLGFEHNRCRWVTRLNIGLQFLARGLSISHEIRMKSGGFHEIHPNLIKSEEFLLKHQKSFCSNIWFYKVWGEFHLKSARFHEIHWISWWNPLEFTDFMKSARFHGEICQISWISWNPLDFMKSARFYGEIHRISWWNPPDFMNLSFWVMIKYRSFYRKTNEVDLRSQHAVMCCHLMFVSTNFQWCCHLMFVNT